MNKRITSLVVLTMCALFLGIFSRPAAADDNCANKTGQDKVNCLQDKVTQTSQQADTLAGTISQINGKILVAQLQVQQTKNEISQLETQIQDLSTRISGLNTSLDSMTDILIQRVVVNYKRHQSNPLELLLVSNTIDSFFTKYKYLQIAQEHTGEMMAQAENQKTSFDQQKTLKQEKQDELDKKKAVLQQQQNDLDQQKTEQQNLLAQTKNDEATYQRLLSEAKAELAGFSNFTASNGGSALLSGQTSCDDWGCYYNQRDSQWGGMPLNGTKYSIASDGCLVTSMAMVMTHYGHRGVTPISINSNPFNFAAYYPAYLLYSASADGATASRVSMSRGSIEGVLSGGNPVIVGIHAYGGTHFVVLKSGHSGAYIMNDPYLENGKDMKFNDHYSEGSIYEVNKIVVN